MRLRNEARFALEELAERFGCSQTAVVERLVIAAHAGRQAEGVNWATMESSGVAATRVPELETPEPVGRGYLPCRHCGVDGLIHPKTSPWRACPGCQRDGHMNFADCMKCARRDRARELAAKSTAADTSTIDFDPEW